MRTLFKVTLKRNRFFFYFVLCWCFYVILAAARNPDSVKCACDSPFILFYLGYWAVAAVISHVVLSATFESICDERTFVYCLMLSHCWWVISRFQVQCRWNTRRSVRKTFNFERDERMCLVCRIVKLIVSSHFQWIDSIEMYSFCFNIEWIIYVCLFACEHNSLNKNLSAPMCGLLWNDDDKCINTERSEIQLKIANNIIHHVWNIHPNVLDTEIHCALQFIDSTLPKFWWSFSKHTHTYSEWNIQSNREFWFISRYCIFAHIRIPVLGIRTLTLTLTHSVSELMKKQRTKRATNKTKIMLSKEFELRICMHFVCVFCVE